MCELYSTESFDEEKIIGEIALDATASDESGLDAIVLLQYPYMISTRTPEESFEILSNQMVSMDMWEPMKRFSSNLN